MSAYSYQFESYRDRRILGRNLGATIKRWAMQRADLIEALSDSIRQDLIRRGLDARRIVVAPNSFTDLAACLPATKKRGWIVFTGRFVEIKNPLLLLDALPEVLKFHADCHVFFLGEGALETSMRRRVRELGLDAYVTIRFEPQPTQVLNESSIFVSLQSEENYPSQSLLEAMACAWRLVDETTGVRVPLQPAAVAVAINQLLADPLLAERQRAARQRVLTEHMPERFLAYIIGVYQDAFQAHKLCS
jgi:glycosyltransferase involved in cell wall biosynthesis